jgi:hypothetical protein
MMRRMPSAFAGAFSGSALTAGGVWNLVSSTRPWPSEQGHAVARIVMRVFEVRLRLTVPERRHAADAVERSWRPTVPRPER